MLLRIVVDGQIVQARAGTNTLYSHLSCFRCRLVMSRLWHGEVVRVAEVAGRFRRVLTAMLAGDSRM